MPFKVVQTIEHGETFLMAVPSGWEEAGVLRWPPKNVVMRLSRDEKSVPSEKWSTLPCAKKREFLTYVEAEEEIARMEQISDTENEGALTPLNKRAAGKDTVKDYNNLIQAADQTEVSAPPQKKICSGAIAVDSVNDFNDLFVLPGQEILTEEIEQTENNVQTGFTPIAILTAGNGCLKSTQGLVINPESMQNDVQGTLLRNQQLIIDNQIKLMQAMAKLQTTVDYLVQYNLCGSANETREIQMAPVNSIEELTALEESLKDEAVVTRYVENMGFICGTNGKGKGIDCCYKLIDIFMTREFAHKCSWTGNTKVTDENVALNEQEQVSASGGKTPLKFFGRFRALFLQLIRLADKEFTELSCDDFFKRITRNSKARLQNKATSSHKNRPKKLVYKKRNNDSDASKDAPNAPTTKDNDINLEPVQ